MLLINDSVDSAETAQDQTQFDLRPVADFSPRVAICIERGDYIVKTADRYEELDQLHRLRYQVFFEEFSGRQADAADMGMDRDAYDELCDHLVIVDRRDNQVVGTYRMISSQWSERFYTQEEFDIDGLLALPGAKLELGRACVHPDYRNGIVMSLLWKGVMAFAQECGAEWLFGCSSVKTTHVDEAAALMLDLRYRGAWSSALKTRPTERCRMHGLDEAITGLESECDDMPRSRFQHAELPSLLEGYLRAGAIVHGEPALDIDFGCIDFLTALRLSAITPIFERKYGR